MHTYTIIIMIITILNDANANPNANTTAWPGGTPGPPARPGRRSRATSWARRGTSLPPPWFYLSH